MSTDLLPGIPDLDTDSLCYSLYNQLYHNFFNAQDSGSVTEGDPISIRLRNTAFQFADAISGSITGEGNGGTNQGVLLDYLKKSGGDMIGHLRANYGFEGGINNSCVIKIYENENSTGVDILGDLQVSGHSFYLGGKNVLSYDNISDRLNIKSQEILFGNGILQGSGQVIVGDQYQKVEIMNSGILIRGNQVFHAGNANQPDIDWNMNNGYVSGQLEIRGTAVLCGQLEAIHGVILGDNGKSIAQIKDNEFLIEGFLTLGTDSGIRMNDIPVFKRNGPDVIIGAAKGDLLMGNDHTDKLRLCSALTDIGGEYVLLTRYGGAYFPDSIEIRHHFGSTLFSSYRTDSEDEGMIIHQRLRFGNQTAPYLTGNKSGIAFHGTVSHIAPGTDEQVSPYYFQLGYENSVSNYRPLNRISDSLNLKTDADFININKPVEAINHIGISGSYSRLADGKLYLGKENYISAMPGGIQYPGLSVFLSDLSSLYFSSGFAGSGWSIAHSKLTGNVCATVDEIVVRKKMRVYELEIEKQSSTNGSLWISDCCQGDRVTKL